MYRRCAIALILVTGGFWVYMNLVLCMLLSFLNLCYLLAHKPFQKGNKIELANEMAIYLVGMLLI